MNFHLQTGLVCNHTIEQYWRNEQSSSQPYSQELITTSTNAHNNNTSVAAQQFSQYSYSSSQQFLPCHNTIRTSASPLISLSPISYPHFPSYSVIENYEETSAVYAEEGMARYPSQIPEYSDYSRDSFQSDTISNTLELVHSYRRLPLTDDFDYLNNTASDASQKKKLAGQIPVNKQQLSAKYECIACHARFSYESSAKRHQLNQVKRFRCNVCNQKFARVDYRNWHQRRCEIGFRLSDEKRPG